MEPIHVPMLLYSITAAMFIPTIHSLIFHKSCLHYSNTTCSNDNILANRDENIHKHANLVLLFSSSALCITGMISSSVIGHVGDKVSRKLAMLLPLFGLILSDLTLIAQAAYLETSPYLFIVSEGVFGSFGGYMGIFSAAFSLVSSKYSEKEKRGKAIARLEGVIAVGGMLGYLLSSQLGTSYSYLTVCYFFLIAHFLTILCVLFIRAEPTKATSQDSQLLHDETQKGVGRVLLFAYALSYLAFIGTSRILFFYLKHQFSWDAKQYGYLRASSQATSILATILMYPWLKTQRIKDVTLAVFGLTCRALGRLYYALVTSSSMIFLVVVFEMFSKYPATALRSLVASNSLPSERGRAFSKLARLDAACNLVSSCFFHLLFPLSLPVLSQASFYFMALLIVPAVTAILWNKKTLESSEE